MKILKRLAVAGLLGAVLAVVPLAASAQTTPGTTGHDYGQHVAQCAQLMGGFSNAMNPGMHQGFSGWNGMTCMP